MKFRGAGQGPRVLVAEWLAGEIARALDLRVPDIVAVDLEAAIADSEPDQEIHDLLVASVGRNIGLDFLPGSMTFNAVVDARPDPDWAAAVDLARRTRRRIPIGRRRTRTSSSGTAGHG